MTLVVGVLALTLVACGGHGPPRASSSQRTCLVLSVGGTRGMAHAGAVDALLEQGFEFDCVYGNSAGALVGGIYATAPREPVTPRLQAMLQGNVRATESEVVERAGLGLLIGLFLGPAGALAGAALGAATTTPVHLGRAVRVLDDQLGGVDIEDLSLEFRTAHLHQVGEGVQLVEVDHGNLADAIGHSVANPFIFGDVSLPERPRFDPGADRVAAVPVFDACRAFPDARLIVLNASDHEPFEHGVDCPTFHIRIADVRGVDSESIMRGEGGLELAAAFGRASVLEALGELPVHVADESVLQESRGGFIWTSTQGQVELRSNGSTLEYRVVGGEWTTLRRGGRPGVVVPTDRGGLIVTVEASGVRLMFLHEWVGGRLVPTLAWSGTLGEELPTWLRRP